MPSDGAPSEGGPTAPVGKTRARSEGGPTAPTAPLARAVDFFLRTEASSRPAAFLRIGLPLLLWSRWGSEFLLYRNLTLPQLLVTVSFFGSTLLMLVGFKSRIVAAWAGLTAWCAIYYFGIILKRDAFVHHHTSLMAISTLLVAFTPCDASYSVDRWLALKRAERAGTAPPAERGNQWGIRLLALQVSAVYFWGALDKTKMVFLSGDRMEAISLYFYFGSDRPTSAFFRPFIVASSLGTLVLEYVLAFGLWIPRLRRWLLPIGIIFHATIYFTLPVVTFTVTMWLLYLAYVPPDALHDLIERMSGHGPRPNSGSVSS